MKKRSQAEWQRLFDAHASSGLSAAAFCREQGLCPKYFSLRRKQLQGKPTPSLAVKPKKQRETSAFVPVSFGSDRESVIVVRWGELTVSVPGNVAPGWLSSFVLGLKG